MNKLRRVFGFNKDQVRRNAAEKKSAPRVRFQSGTVYEIMPSGALVRVFPVKPWKNKAERRAYRREKIAALKAAV